MTTQLNSKLLTLNSNRKQKRTLRQKGFTLIELMVVTAVAGVLGAVAVPKFLGARDIANAKAQIAAAVGVGKECKTWIDTDGTGLTSAPVNTDSTKGPVVACNTTSGTITHANQFKIPTGLTTPLKCLNDLSADGDTGILLTVSATDFTCQFT